MVGVKMRGDIGGNAVTAYKYPNDNDKAKYAHLFFSLLLLYTHCEPPREGVCEILKKEIERSYEKDINKSTRIQMLMQYENLDCGPLPPKNSFDKQY